MSGAFNRRASDSALPVKPISDDLWTGLAGAEVFSGDKMRPVVVEGHPAGLLIASGQGLAIITEDGDEYAIDMPIPRQWMGRCMLQEMEVRLYSPEGSTVWGFKKR